jgi:DsbC/DsbD-like thiol-disulfide interchange protein
MTRSFPRRGGAALVIAGLVMLALGTRPANAGGKSDDEVKLTANAGKLDASGKQTITVTAVINKGWHIYANPVGNEELAAAATIVKVMAKAKPQEVKVNYPAGTEANDKVIGKYRYYADKVEIPIDIQRAAGDTGPLEISVRFMACNKSGICKLPATVKLAVK